MLGCLTWHGLDRYPDATRQRAEFGMALLSLGAAVENFMVAAADAGYASCWVAAPIFCPEAARDALALDPEWLPHAMVVVGRPDPDYVGSSPTADPPRRAPRLPLRRAGQPGLVSEPVDGEARPSSSGVHGFHPRWIAARPGSSAERASSPARAGARFGGSG